jgi:hypothetical protein
MINLPSAPRTIPFFQWVDRQFSQAANTGRLAYESERMAWRPMIGSGVGVRGQLATVSPCPWNVQLAATAWLTGLGGLSHGQTALQPLSNPYQGS